MHENLKKDTNRTPVLPDKGSDELSSLSTCIGNAAKSIVAAIKELRANLSYTNQLSKEVELGPYGSRPGRRFIASTKVLLEYAPRRPENFTNIDEVYDSIRIKDLNNGFTLEVNDRGFSIIQSTAQGKASLVKQVTFRDSLSKRAQSVKYFSSDILPNSILHSGPSSWLVNVYFPVNHAIHTYGIKIEESTLQVEYLFRVKLFTEGLVSPPFIVSGPATVYKGNDGKVYAYWYLEESDDVEKLFESKEPLDGDLKNPAIDKDGNLTFTCGDKSYSHAVFYKEYWLKHIERVNKGE